MISRKRKTNESNTFGHARSDANRYRSDYPSRKGDNPESFSRAVAGDKIPAPDPTPDPKPDPKPDPVPNGDDAGPELRDLFGEQWKGSKGKTLVLPYKKGTVLSVWPKKDAAGNYQTGRHLNIERLEDCVVDFNGVTLKFMMPQTQLLLEELRNVTLQNGTLEGTADLATLSRWDASGRKFVIEDGWPTGTAVYTASSIPGDYTGGNLTESTIYREDFIQDLSRHRGSTDRYGTYHLIGREWVWQAGPLPDFQDGARVMLQLENNDGHAIRPDNEDFIVGLTVQDMTLRNIPGMGITGETDGDTVIRRIKFERAAGALLAVASDGIHFDNSRPGVLIEDCDLSYINDDFVNCNSKASAITHIVGNAVTVSAIPEASGAINIGKWCDPGERMVFTTRTTTGIPTNNGPAIVTKSKKKSTEKSKAHTFEVESVSGLEVGMICVNADRSTGDVVIRNNRFSHTRATGIKARAEHPDL